MLFKKTIIFFLIISFLFSCGREEDEILQYFHNHEAAYSYLDAFVNEKMTESHHKYQVNKKCFEQKHKLMLDIGEKTNSLIKEIEENSEDFQLSTLSDYKEYITKILNSAKGDSISKIQLVKLLDSKLIYQNTFSEISRAILKNKIKRIQYYLYRSILKPYEYTNKREIEIVVNPEQKQIKKGTFYKTNIFLMHKKPKYYKDSCVIVINQDTFFTKNEIFNYRTMNMVNPGIYDIACEWLFFRNCINDTITFPFKINFEVVK